jgi:hypothetical protein
VKLPLLTTSDGAAVTRRNRHRKTRAFQCSLIRAVSWPAYRDNPGRGSAIRRPIFLDFCGSESEHRAFTANLRCGSVATIEGRDGFELLKSEPYLYLPAQKCEAGMRQVVYLPEVFDLDSRQAPDEIWLCAMPPERLLSTLTQRERHAVGEAFRLVNARITLQRDELEEANSAARRANEYWRCRSLPEPVELDDAALNFWALTARELLIRLDSRTLYPIPPDPEFRALLLLELLHSGHAQLCADHPLQPLAGRADSWRMPIQVHGPEGERWNTVAGCGYLAPTALRIKQVQLGEMLAELCRGYYAATATGEK